MSRTSQKSLITVWFVGCFSALGSAVVGYLASADLVVSAILLLMGLASALVMFSLAMRLSGREAKAVLEAQTDALTGVLNRRGLLIRAATEWKNALRYRHTIGVITIDLDGFKSVNDRFGHQAGDRCLRDVTQAIQTCARRRTDIVARTGGDEFVLMIPNIDTSGLRELAQQVRQGVDESGMDNGFGVTASIGTSIAEPHKEDFETALARADRQLLTAKAAGKNQVSGDEYSAVRVRPSHPDFEKHRDLQKAVQRRSG